MKFPNDAPISEAKLNTLRTRIDCLQINLSEVEEKFIKTGGPGGQKVNKTSCGVQLKCPAHKLVIKYAQERSRILNRFLALRELVDQIEEKISPETSARVKERARIKKQKKRRKRRADNG